MVSSSAGALIAENSQIPRQAAMGLHPNEARRTQKNPPVSSVVNAVCKFGRIIRYPMRKFFKRC